MAKASAVSKLLNGAESYLQFCTNHHLPVPPDLVDVVTRVRQALGSTDNAGQVAVENQDLATVHDLSNANDRVYCSWIRKSLEAFCVASWLIPVPFVLIGLATSLGSSSWGILPETIAVWILAPLIVAFTVGLYLPFRFVSSLALMLLRVLSEQPAVSSSGNEWDGLFLFNAIFCAAGIAVLFAPSWLIARRIRTGQRSPMAFISAALIVGLLLGGLLMRGV